MTDEARNAEISEAARLAIEEARRAEINEVVKLAAEAIPQGPREPVKPTPVRFSKTYEAAALLSRFHINDAKAFTASSDEVEELLFDCIPVSDAKLRGTFALVPSIRGGVLRQIASEQRLTEAIHEVESKVATASTDALCGSLEKLSHSGRAALGDLSKKELATVAPVLDSIQSIIPNFPSREDAERRLGLLQLLEPFKRLVGDHFRGRAKELRTLRGYVDVLDSESVLEAVGRFFSFAKKRPLLVHGAGGAGKSTLIAKFILDHVEGAFRFPFAYLDYDRRAVSVDEPASILIEAVRQFGLQYPDARKAAETLCDSWRSLLASAIPARESNDTVNPNSPIYDLTLAARKRIRDEFVSFVARMTPDSSSPVLLVLDTFEEVQYHSRAYVDGLQQFLDDLRNDIPRLRVVLAGRALVPDFDVHSDSFELADFDEPAAVGFLQASGIEDPEIATKIFKRVTGNPLSLRLAAEVYWRNDGKIDGIMSLSRKTNIQGQLVERILDHVHKPEIRKIAHPGLVLRRVTPDLIRKVLAEPCGLEVPDDETAKELFRELKREIALVSVSDGDAVTHNVEVRKLMLDPLREDQPVKVERIQRNAIAYYSQFDDPVSRAEEIYHRLSLHEDLEMVAPRFDPPLRSTLRKLLGSSLDELGLPEQAWLAERLEIEIPPEAVAAAKGEVWERAAERRLDEYLRQRNYEAALQLLGERKDRSPRTMVLVREAMVYLGMGDLANADRVSNDAIKTYMVGNRRALFEALMVAADVAQRLGIFEESKKHLARAENIARQENDAFRLLRALVGRCMWSDLQKQPRDSELIEELSVTARQVDDTTWIGDPPMLRFVATIVGEKDPLLLAKALQLATPSPLPADRERLFRAILPSAARTVGPLHVAVALALALPTIAPAVITMATQWLAEQVRREMTDETEKTPRKKSLLSRDDIGPFVAGLHLKRAEIASIVEHIRNRSLESISIAQDDYGVLSDVLDAAERGHWLAEFVDAVRLAHRDEAFLLALDQAGMGISVSDTGSLSTEDVSASVAKHRLRLAVLQHATCRIEHRSKLTGTGVLVGENRVLTVGGALPAESIEASVRFDYGMIGGTVHNSGTNSYLRQARVFDGASGAVAFLTVARLIGRELIGGERSVPSAFTRAWVTRENDAPVQPGARVFWLWHSAKKLEIAGARVVSISDTNIVLDTKPRAECVGAPCFDDTFEFVGVHGGALAITRGRTTIFPIGYVNAVEAFSSNPWYVDGTPVLGRESLRRKLVDMTQDRGSRILMVNGPRGSGKTFTIRIIRQLAKIRGFDVTAIDLHQYETLTPFDIAESITMRFGLPNPPPASAQEQWSRWSLRFLDKLTAHLHDSNASNMRWIVIDGFATVPRSESVDVFVSSLAIRIHETLPQLRLVLIGYERGLPQQVTSTVVSEYLAPLSDHDVAAFFTRFYEDRLPDATADEIAQAAVAAASKVHLVGGALLEEIGDLVTNATVSLEHDLQ